MANFKKLAKGYENKAVATLKQFIKINSVYDATTAREGQPYGFGVKKALDFVGRLGKDFGWKVDSVNGYCTELTIGEEGPLIGIYGHSDVVPATGTWTTGPFNPDERDGVIYGRGACDDKGPLVAAIYATKLLQDAGLLKGFRVKIVSGGDEERGSSCLDYYFNKFKGEAAKYAFTPDADYPLIYAEKGMRAYSLTKTIDLGPVTAMDGGIVTNAVCDSLLVTLKLDKKFEEYLKTNNVPCDISSNEFITVVRFKGKAAHGSTPEKGINAAAIAFKAIGEFYKLKDLVDIVPVINSGDGAYWGGNVVSKELGGCSYNYGIIKYEKRTKVLSLSLDFRFGEDAKRDDLVAALVAKTGFTATPLNDGHDHLLFDKKSPLVSTLMKAYKAETFDLFAKPLAIGGGTYAKEAPNCVAFGAVFPANREAQGNMHGVDEFISRKDFMKDIAIYARAIYMLGNLK